MATSPVEEYRMLANITISFEAFVAIFSYMEYKVFETRTHAYSSETQAITHKTFTQLEEKYNSHWYRSTETVLSENPSTHWLSKKKWPLSEELNLHMLRFQQVTLYNLICI